MAADPYLISGTLPFGQGGNPFQGAQGGLAGIAGQYGQGYNSALAQNQANYGNILEGYRSVMGGQRSAQDAIGQGYSQLYNNVLGGIQGIGASQGQQIRDTAAQQSGAMGQSLISRGLGNTTIADTMQRGIQSDEQKAQTALANQIAQLNAGYQSNLGLAGLSQQERAVGQNTQLAGHQLDWMNSVNSLYPNSQEYNQLFRDQGQAQQAAQNRQLMMQLGQRGGATAMPAGGGVNWNQGASIGRGSSRIPDVTSLSPMAPSYGYGGGGGNFIDAYNQGGGGVTQNFEQDSQLYPGSPATSAYDPYNLGQGQAPGAAYDPYSGGSGYSNYVGGYGGGTPSATDYSSMYGYEGDQ